MRRKRIIAGFAVVVVIAGVLAWLSTRRTGLHVASAAPTSVEESHQNQLTMSDVLDMAVAARQHMADHLDDYTARFVKQEVDLYGVLGEESEILMKVQTRLRGDGEEAPMRVYLKYQSPEAVKGREVIWGEDLYDGKLAVHEVGLILGLKTIWLDPNGMIAMQGQRYPISEIGMVRLVEKLIERGEKDRNNPDIQVTLTEQYDMDGTPCQLIQVRRSKPGGGEDDFSLAEIIIDPQRQLILTFRSFGWPPQEGEDPPLLESYSYYDVKTNVGLTKEDFDTKNPNYGFPAF